MPMIAWTWFFGCYSCAILTIHRSFIPEQAFVIIILRHHAAIPHLTEMSLKGIFRFLMQGNQSVRDIDRAVHLTQDQSRRDRCHRDADNVDRWWKRFATRRMKVIIRRRRRPRQRTIFKGCQEYILLGFLFPKRLTPCYLNVSVTPHFRSSTLLSRCSLIVDQFQFDHLRYMSWADKGRCRADVGD